MIDRNRNSYIAISMIRERGFTLIELMIAIVILGLLVSIALPAYSDYVIRGQRQAGKNMLHRIADRQEQYFMDNKQYADDLSDLGYPGETIGVGRDGEVSDATDAGRVYVMSLTNTTATSYTIVATPQLNQASKDTQCGKLSLTHLGVRDASGSGSKCW